MPRQIGNPLNLQRLSGELYWRPTGENGFIHFGDVSLIKEVPEASTIDGYFHTRAATQRQVRHDSKETTLKWEVELQERIQPVEAYLLFGKVGADLVQTLAAAATITFVDVVKGRVYDVGARNITNVVATVAAAPKIEGVRINGEIIPSNADVIVDAALGLIEIAPNGTIATLDDVLITYDKPALTMNVIDGIGQHAIRTGRAKLAMFDGTSTPATKIIEFDGQLTPKDRGQFDIDSFNKFSFELLATGDVTFLTV
jgi:hypothetical protein